MRGEEIILGARSLLFAFGRILFVASCFMLPATRALAAGGGGGGSCNLTGVGGGGGGSTATGIGANGGPAVGCGGGGGGGAGETGGAGGGTGAASGGAGGASPGASGSPGGNFFSARGGGGGGGGGAHGAVVTTSTSNSGSVAGGNGGDGGSPMVAIPGAGGGGGGGGYGVVAVGGGLSFTNTGMVKGGNGGDGGFSIFNVGGFGGNGGDGLVFTGSGGTLINSGSIAGGAGGPGGVGTASNGVIGLGGTGIIGANLSIINSGSITGGLAGDGSTRSKAIYFNGGRNTLELRAGSIITGDVVGATFDTLRLGGASDSTFDVSLIGSQYTGFSTFVKTGNSTWTLTGSTFADTPWTIDHGTLAVSSDSNLGNVGGGPLVFNGGTLQFLAGSSSSRSVTLDTGGGFFDTNGNNVTLAGPISGAGNLTKVGVGTLMLTNTNAYAGGTTISAGTLQLGNGGTGGSIVGNVVNNGVLAFNRANTLIIAGDISGSGGVKQIGSGTTILLGSNSYKGDTIVSAGTLQFGDGSSGGGTGGTGGNAGAGTGGGTGGTGGNAGTGTGSGTGGTGGNAGTGTGGGTGGTGGNAGTGTGGGTGGTGGNAGGATGAGGSGNNIGGNLTVTGGTLAIEMPATLNVAHDVTFADNTQLSIIDAPGGPSLTADSVTIGNGVTFNIGGVTNAGQTDKVLIDTRSGINGDFAVVTVGGVSAGVDYLTISARKSADNSQYLASYGLTWMANNNLAHGTFTLTNATDSFMVGVALGDEAANPVTGWNGTSLTKAGAGTLILSADNTYTGGTTITDGTLQLGVGGTTGSIIGNVVNDGVLAFNRSDAMTFSGDISGSGAVRQIGSGTTILTGNNTYGGGTSLLGGVLSVSSDASLGLSTGGLTFDGGTLQVTGTAFTSTARTINWGANGGGFDIADPSNVFTVNQTLGSGGGSLAKFGAGTLILSGDNTYAGGTTIAGGTLQLGNGSTSGSIVGDVVNNGVLAFDRSDTLTLTGVISGNGAVRQIGSGTTILTGNNTYTGNTTIMSGTLQLGDGNTSGSIVGDVVNKGALAFARSDTLTLAGAISGNGTVRQIGTGTTILAGANTYTGDTTIMRGTLQLGAGGATGSILGNVINNGVLAFNRRNDWSFGGVISGSGDLRHIGLGKTELTGDSSGFTGSTTVENGTLAVNGKLGGSVDVLAAGRLQGIGTVGGTNVSGVIAPGNSIGTLNVGTITFNAGSTYEVEVNAAGQSDKIVASGTATINGGSVQVLAGMGNYAPATTYTILTANGGVAGAFTGGVTSNLAFLDPSLTYDASNVYLTMTRNGVTFQNVGLTPSQTAVGGGVESLGLGNPVYNAVLNLSADQARYAFDQLSGEIHVSAKTAMIEDSRFIRNAVNDRVRAAFDGVGASSTPVMAYADGGPQLAPATTDRFAVWSQAFGSWGNWNSDGNAAGLNRSIGGFFIGADAPVFDRWRFGAVAGYSRTTFNVNDRHSSGSSDNYHFGIYGGTTWGTLALRIGTAYTWQGISISRSVVFPGFGDSLKSDYNAGTAQVFGELGYGIDMGAAGFEPFANLAYVNLHTDGFTENGGAAALTSAAGDTDATFTTLGLRASTTFDLNGMALTAKGTLGWRHAFGDVTPLSTMRFASGGNAFTIAGVPIAQDAAVLDLGFDMKVAQNAMLGISYGGQFGSGVTDQTVHASFNVKF